MSIKRNAYLQRGRAQSFLKGLARTHSRILLAAALATSSMLASAAGDFIGVRRSQSDMNDSVRTLLISFTLPSNVNRSSSTASSAVLDLEALGSEFNYNEIYVNPPTTVCTSNDTDANQPASIGFLQEHDDANLKTEWAANHKAFSSALLLAGTNQLMFCIRNVSGQAGANVGNLDNVSVRSIVLHYHTN
jgi:hypothetical protein